MKVHKAHQRGMLVKLRRLDDIEKKQNDIPCRGGPDTSHGCMRVMKELLPRSGKVYCHHYSGIDWEIQNNEIVFHEVVFGVWHVILAEKRNYTLESCIHSMASDRLLVESDLPNI